MHRFRRCVRRYRGNRKIKSFSCLDQFRCMAFAQLTDRESLRDIEACLRAQQNKLYHMGIRGGISRNTLANANKTRDWRICADFAQALIHIARNLYVDDDFGVELDNTVYALDATTIDLCLSVFPWAQFRTTKGAVKLHTLMDLRGNIPTLIHVSDGKLHDVNVLDLLVPEAGAFYIMDRGYVDFSRLHSLCLSAAFFVIRGKSNLHTMPATLFASCRRTDQTQMRSDRRAHWIPCCQGLPGQTTARQIPRQADGQSVCLFDQQLRVAGADHCRSLPLTLAGGIVLQVDQTTSANQIIFRHNRERCNNSGPDQVICS